jgi:hypothetical protein
LLEISERLPVVTKVEHRPGDVAPGMPLKRRGQPCLQLFTHNSNPVWSEHTDSTTHDPGFSTTILVPDNVEVT